MSSWPQNTVIHRMISEELEEILIEGERVAKSLAPARTGNLVRNITHEGPTRIGRSSWNGNLGVMRTAPYARWVERGTGMFGPFHRRIISSSGGVMSWKMDLAPDARRPKWGRVYATSTKGQPGQHFMWKTYTYLKFFVVPMHAQILEAKIKMVMKDEETIHVDT